MIKVGGRFLVTFCDKEGSTNLTLKDLEQGTPSGNEVGGFLKKHGLINVASAELYNPREVKEVYGAKAAHAFRAATNRIPRKAITELGRSILKKSRYTGSKKIDAIDGHAPFIHPYAMFPEVRDRAKDFNGTYKVTYSENLQCEIATLVADPHSPMGEVKIKRKALEEWDVTISQLLFLDNYYVQRLVIKATPKQHRLLHWNTFHSKNREDYIALHDAKISNAAKNTEDSTEPGHENMRDKVERLSREKTEALKATEKFLSLEDAKSLKVEEPTIEIEYYMVFEK